MDILLVKFLFIRKINREIVDMWSRGEIYWKDIIFWKNLEKVGERIIDMGKDWYVNSYFIVYC